MFPRLFLFVGIALCAGPALAAGGAELFSREEFQQLAEELSPKVNLFRDVWSRDPAAEFYGGTTRDYLYWLKGKFKDARTRAEADAIAKKLRREEVIDVRSFIIGESDVDIFTKEPYAVNPADYGVRKVDAQSPEILDPKSELGISDRHQGFIPAEKVRLSKRAFVSVPELGDGLGEIYSGRLTVHFAKPEEFAETKYAKEGVNHPILLALRYLRVQGINYFQSHGAGYPDKSELLASLDPDSARAVREVIRGVLDGKTLQPFLQQPRFVSWLNGGIQKSFRSYTNPTAAKMLMDEFDVGRLPELYPRMVEPFNQYVFAQHRDPAAIEKAFEKYHVDRGQLFRPVSEVFPDGYLYHGTRTEPQFRSILFQGILQSEGGSAGKGLYGVAEVNKHFAEDWGGDPKRLLRFPVKPNARVVDLTKGEGKRAFESFSGQNYDEFAKAFGADILLYPYKPDAFVVKNSAALGKAEGVYRQVLTIGEVLEKVGAVKSLEELFDLIEMNGLALGERKLLLQKTPYRADPVGRALIEAGGTNFPARYQKLRDLLELVPKIKGLKDVQWFTDSLGGMGDESAYFVQKVAARIAELPPEGLGNGDAWLEFLSRTQNRFIDELNRDLQDFRFLEDSAGRVRKGPEVKAFFSRLNNLNPGGLKKGYFEKALPPDRIQRILADWRKRGILDWASGREWSAAGVPLDGQVLQRITPMAYPNELSRALRKETLDGLLRNSLAVMEEGNSETRYLLDLEFNQAGKMASDRGLKDFLLEEAALRVRSLEDIEAVVRRDSGAAVYLRQADAAEILARPAKTLPEALRKYRIAVDPGGFVGDGTALQTQIRKEAGKFLVHEPRPADYLKQRGFEVDMPELAARILVAMEGNGTGSLPDNFVRQSLLRGNSTQIFRRIVENDGGLLPADLTGAILDLVRRNAPGSSAAFAELSASNRDYYHTQGTPLESYVQRNPERWHEVWDVFYERPYLYEKTRWGGLGYKSGRGAPEIVTKTFLAGSERLLEHDPLRWFGADGGSHEVKATRQAYEIFAHMLDRQGPWSRNLFHSPRSEAWLDAYVKVATGALDTAWRNSLNYHDDRPEKQLHYLFLAPEVQKMKKAPGWLNDIITSPHLDSSLDQWFLDNILRQEPWSSHPLAKVWADALKIRRGRKDGPLKPQEYQRLDGSLGSRLTAPTDRNFRPRVAYVESRKKLMPFLDARIARWERKVAGAKAEYLEIYRKDTFGSPSSDEDCRSFYQNLFHEHGKLSLPWTKE